MANEKESKTLGTERKHEPDPNVEVQQGREVPDRNADQRANIQHADAENQETERRDNAAGAGSRTDFTERRNLISVRFLRDLMIAGEHEEKGTIFAVPRPLAARLVGEGAAEYIDPQAAPTTVTHMQEAQNREPAPQRVSAPDPKMKGHTAR